MLREKPELARLPVMILSGDLNSGILGPYKNRSANDNGIIHSWLLSSTANAPLAIFTQGDGFVEDTDGEQVPTDMHVILRDHNYTGLSHNTSHHCIDVLAAG